MPERHEYRPRPLPFDVLNGADVEQSLRENRKGFTLREGTKVLLLVNSNHEMKNLGPLRLSNDVRGYFTKVENEPYHGLSADALRLNFIPDSDERRERTALYRMGVRNSENVLASIDQQLAKDFFEDKQDILDSYYIDPESVERVTFQIAVNKNIQTSF